MKANHDIAKQDPFAPAPHPNPLPREAREQEDLATREVPPSRGIKGPAPPARDAVPLPAPKARQRGGKPRQRRRGVLRITPP